MPDSLPRRHSVLLHIAFWVMYATYFVYSIGFSRPEQPEWSRILPDVAIHVAGLVIISYVNYFFFLPRLLAGRKVGRYLLTFGPLFVLLCYLIVVAKQIAVAPLVDNVGFLYSPRFVVHNYVSGVFVVVFTSFIRFVEDYFQLEQRNREMENRQLTSELRFLKAQVNPHFLFNTLNNLYYLAVNESPQTPEVIAKLSGMMRYMIHESNTEKVSLRREVDYMENYLDLEKLRLNEEVPIAFEVEGDIDHVRITPLILITFLENAFKHGIGNGRKDSWITVSLRVGEGQLANEVANSKMPEADKTVREASGLGLANVRRRLELSYPGRYGLDVAQDDDSYRVHLKIQYA